MGLGPSFLLGTFWWHLSNLMPLSGPVISSCPASPLYFPGHFLLDAGTLMESWHLLMQLQAVTASSTSMIWGNKSLFLPGMLFTFSTERFHLSDF